MAETIVDGTQLNIQSIKYSAPKANASGGKSINILNKATHSGLRISTPIMLTWGASDFENNGKYDMSLQFPSEEYKNADTDAFFKNMEALEAKIKADALIYTKEWFGKVHKSADVVDALFTPMLKYPKVKGTKELDMTKPPSLRVKIPLWDGVWKCEIYDEEHKRTFPNADNPSITPLDLLQKGINVACLLQCGGLWFANGNFGITWKLIQAVAQKPRATLSGQCFIKLKTNDKEKLKSAPLVTEGEGEEEDEDAQAPARVVSTQVVDSDEEPDEEPEYAPVATPKPTPTPAPVAEAQVAVEEAKAPAKKKLTIKPKKAAE